MMANPNTDEPNGPGVLQGVYNRHAQTEAAEVRKMLNSISWYYKRTLALEVPNDLAANLPKTLKEICEVYTS